MMRYVIFFVWLLTTSLVYAQHPVSYQAAWANGSPEIPVDRYVLYICNAPLDDNLACEGKRGFKITDQLGVQGVYDSPQEVGTMYFRVVAENDVGPSEPSDMVSIGFDVSGGGEVPGKPVNVTVTIQVTVTNP